MDSLVIVFDNENALNEFRTKFGRRKDYKENRQNDVYSAMLENADSKTISYYIDYIFYEDFSGKGSYKAGQFIKNNFNEEGFLSGFGCNCADTDLPMIEDVYREFCNSAVT